MHITRHRKAARPLRFIICGAAGAALLAAGTAAGAVAPAAAHQGLTAPLKYQGQLLSVSADSPADAWAIGNGIDIQSTVHWNGTSLAKVRWPSPTSDIELASVSAVSADDAWAVGTSPTAAADTSKAFIIRWNGTHWTSVPAGAAAHSSLLGVSADSATDAWAVGDIDSTSPAHPFRTLILHWNGTAWTRVPSPDPGGASEGGSLTAISASSPTDAWAIGSYAASGTVSDSLALHWDGTSWTQVATPYSGATGRLYDVSGTSPTDIWAVGTYGRSALPRNGRDLGLVLHWNGTGWTQF